MKEPSVETKIKEILEKIAFNYDCGFHVEGMSTDQAEAQIQALIDQKVKEAKMIPFYSELVKITHTQHDGYVSIDTKELYKDIVEEAIKADRAQMREEIEKMPIYPHDTEAIDSPQYSERLIRKEDVLAILEDNS